MQKPSPQLQEVMKSLQSTYSPVMKEAREIQSSLKYVLTLCTRQSAEYSHVADILASHRRLTVEIQRFRSRLALLQGRNGVPMYEAENLPLPQSLKQLACSDADDAGDVPF